MSFKALNRLIHELIPTKLSDLDDDIAHRVVTDIEKSTWNVKVDITNVLTLDNVIAFTPDADYEPATKKYVDDNAGAFSGDMDDIADGTTYKKVSTTEKSTWNSKANALGADDNYITDAEKLNLHAPGSDNQVLPVNSDFTLNGLGEKSYNNLTDKPTGTLIFTYNL